MKKALSPFLRCHGDDRHRPGTGGRLFTMKDFRQRAAHKLRSNAGETIGETLIALLISALALVMLAGAISSTANMITASDRQMGKYYDGDDNLVKQTTPGGDPLTVTLTGKIGTIKTIEIHTSKIRWYKNDAFANKPVVAYKLPPIS